MRAVLKREIRNYFKNPLYWIGIVIVMILTYQMVSPYLSVRYFETEEEISQIEISEDDDLDIMQGYVISTPKEQIEYGIQSMEQDLEQYEENKEGQILYWENPNQDPAKIAEDVRNQNFSDIPQAVRYLEETYQIYGSDYYFEEAIYHRGDLNEVNSYLEEKLEEHPYSYYFARKFTDFCGMLMGFFATVLLAVLFLRDTRKDIYELLHTKPIKASSYILGKIGGGMAVIGIALLILTGIFGILCEIHGRREGLPVRFSDFVVHVICYILPNMLMITSVYAAIAVIFKNPLPAIPLLFLYIVYSNMGSRVDGVYGYYGRPLAIMVRFPGMFLDTNPPPLAMWNQIFLIVASIALISITAVIFKRRRFY